MHLIATDGSGDYPLDGGAQVGSYCWAPSGDVLAYVGAAGGLYTIGGDGTDRQALVPEGEEGGRVDHVAWSPDGRWIAYEWRSGDAPSGAPVREGLWQVSTETGDRTEVYTEGASERHIALWGWSADGKRILFWQALPPDHEPGAALYSVPTGGGSARAFAQEAQAPPWSIPPHSGAVAPSAQAMAGTGPGRLALAVNGASPLWSATRLALADLGGGTGVPLTPEGEGAFWPAWSPDGSRLAYSAAPDAKRGAPVDCHIQTLNPGNGERRRLTDDPAYRDERPLWSAGGSKLLFVRWDGRGRASLWLLPAAGGTPKQIVDQLSLPSSPGQRDGYVDWGSLYDWWRGSPLRPGAARLP